MLFLFFGQNYEHQLRRSFGQTTHRVIHIVASHHGDQTRAVNIPLILALCHSVHIQRTSKAIVWTFTYFHATH